MPRGELQVHVAKNNGILRDDLNTNQIKWQFNLSRVPWWGGQFERLICLVKSALNKTIGNGLLRWKELQEVLLDVEITLNRPLSYVEDDVQMPLLTPNAMLLLNSNLLPELQPHHIETADLRKRAKHLMKCKEAIWNRRTKEYLRERHRAQREAGGDTPAVGNVVIVKTEDKNRGKWLLGIIESLIVGNDRVIRGAKLRAGKSYMERAIQQLYPWNCHVTDRRQHRRRGWTQKLLHFARDGMLQLQRAYAYKKLPKRRTEMNS